MKLLEKVALDPAKVRDGIAYVIDGTDITVWLRPVGPMNRTYAAAHTRLEERFRQQLKADPRFPPFERGVMEAFFEHCVVRWEGEDTIDPDTGRPYPFTAETFSALWQANEALFVDMVQTARQHGAYRRERLEEHVAAVGNGSAGSSVSDLSSSSSSASAPPAAPAEPSTTSQG